MAGRRFEAPHCHCPGGPTFRLQILHTRVAADVSLPSQFAQQALGVPHARLQPLVDVRLERVQFGGAGALGPDTGNRAGRSDQKPAASKHLLSSRIPLSIDLVW